MSIQQSHLNKSHLDERQYRPLLLHDSSSLNVPTELSVEDLGQNKYKLSWKYTNAAGRSENGFVIEELDEGATTIEWTRKNALTTNKGVQFIVVSASENAVSYRVAAQDDKGESEFRRQVL